MEIQITELLLANVVWNIAYCIDRRRTVNIDLLDIVYHDRTIVLP